MFSSSVCLLNNFHRKFFFFFFLSYDLGRCFFFGKHQILSTCCQRLFLSASSHQLCSNRHTVPPVGRQKSKCEINICGFTTASRFPWIEVKWHAATTTTTESSQKQEFLEVQEYSGRLVSEDMLHSPLGLRARKRSRPAETGVPGRQEVKFEDVRLYLVERKMGSSRRSFLTQLARSKGFIVDDALRLGKSSPLLLFTVSGAGMKGT